MIGQTSECNIYPLHDWLAIVLHAYIALVDAARNAFLLGTSTYGSQLPVIYMLPAALYTTQPLSSAW